MGNPSDFSIIKNFVEFLTEISAAPKIINTAEGWNNRIYQIDDEYILKTPLNREAERQLNLEVRISGFLSGRISVPVPLFIHYGKMENGTFAALYRKLNGVNITNTVYGRNEERIAPSELDIAERTDFYRRIAGVAWEIGLIDPFMIPGIPRRGGMELMKHYMDLLHTARDKLFGLIDGNTGKAIEKEFAHILKPELFSFVPQFIHGDLGGWNVLYDVKKRDVSGLIDWGNCSFSDPALDYSELVYDYGQEFSGIFLKNTNNTVLEINSRFMRRSEFYIRISGIIDVLYGIENDSTSYVKKGLEDIEKKFGT